MAKAGNIPYKEFAWAILPLVIPLLAVLLIFTYWPGIVMVLLNFLLSTRTLGVNTTFIISIFN